MESLCDRGSIMESPDRDRIPSACQNEQKQKARIDCKCAVTHQINLLIVALSESVVAFSGRLLLVTFCS